MDDTQDKQAKPTDFNKLDLSQLQSFSFGTKWEKAEPSQSRADDERRDGRRGPGRNSGGFAPRDGRDGGRRGPGAGGAGGRDRRGFRKPAGDPEHAPREGGSFAGEGARGSGSQRGFAESRGTGAGGGGPRRSGPQRPYDREYTRLEPPYESPHFAVSFYPEDKSFASLAKTIRSSYRTLELFDIARTVIAKNDRFIAQLTRRPSDAAESASAARQPIYIARPDGVPFDSEEAVINYVIAQHIGQFFQTEQLQIDPPKGNYQVINRCGVTGELLGPPNYHRYSQIVQQHFDTRIKHISLEAFRAKIETLRDPEIVAQWLEKMKTVTRYTWRTASEAKKQEPLEPKTKAAEPADHASAATTEAAAAQEAEAPPPEHTPQPEPAAPTEAAAGAVEAAAPSAADPADVATTASAAPTAPHFDSLEEARLYLLSHARNRIYRTSDTARFHGNLLDKLPEGEIRRAIEGALERQRRFPLDTANGLRGRLRREHFTIFKKGSKGIAYVCAVKRKFRTPGQSFADSIASLIDFIERHPMVLVSELPERFLGIKTAAKPAATEAAAKPTEAPAPATAEAASASEAAASAPAQPSASASAVDAAAAQSAAAADSREEREALQRLHLDLRWLVTEGYVTEFIDGRLFAAPPLPEARKRAAESGEEHDPENFPEAPKPEAPKAEAAKPETAATEAPKGEVSTPEAKSVEASAAEPAPIVAEAAATEVAVENVEAQAAPAELPKAAPAATESAEPTPKSTA